MIIVSIRTAKARRSSQDQFNPSRCVFVSVFYAGTSVYFSNSLSPIITTSNGGIENVNLHYYHLVKPLDEQQYFSTKISDRMHKAIPEIYLTRLLSTKGTVQKFVDDFFGTILTANEALPPAVKWLFDLFDEAFRRHNIMDPEVLHAWKSNRYEERRLPRDLIN